MVGDRGADTCDDVGVDGEEAGGGGGLSRRCGSLGGLGRRWVEMGV